VDGEYLQRRRGFGLASGESTGTSVSLETGTRFRADLVLADLAATRALGSELAVWLLELEPPRPLLLLKGELGAGKTSLVQGLAAALGIEEPVTSPSFALAQHYSGRREAVSAISSILTSTAWSRPLPPMSCSPQGRGRSPVAWCPAGGGMARAPEPAARAGLDGGTVPWRRRPPCPDHAGGFSGLAPLLSAENCCKKVSTSAALGWGSIAPDPAQTRAPQALPKRMACRTPSGLAVVFSAAVSRLGSRQRRCSRPAREGVAGGRWCRPPPA